MPQSPKILCLKPSKDHELVHHLLDGEGYELDLHVDAAGLRKALSTQKPSLLLLGTELPREQWLDLCRGIRTQYSSIELPILLLSNGSDGPEVTEGLRAGANDSIVAEGDLDQQRMRVRNYLSLVKQQEEMIRARDSMSQMIRVQNALCDVLPHGIVVHDRDGTIVHYNQVLKEWCRGEVPDNFLGLKDSICDGAISDLIESRWEEVRNSAESLEQLVTTTHFVFRNVAITSCPIHANVGQNLRLWTFKDVTDSRELELKRDVDVALESVSTFVHGVAHNFNNILASVLGSASLLDRQEMRDDRAKACVRAIKKSAESGAALTRKMMVMVREPVTGGDVGFESVKSVLALIIESFNEQFGARIIFQLDADDDLPAIRVNVRNLADIFSNIVSNAVDSITESGWVLIRAQHRASTNTIEVTISDNGRGMDERTLRRLFEPFFTTKNLDVKHQVSRTGNGLGMWNVYNLVRLLGGDIQVGSSSNEGTRVLVTLPVGA